MNDSLAFCSHVAAALSVPHPLSWAVVQNPTQVASDVTAVAALLFARNPGACATPAGAAAFLEGCRVVWPRAGDDAPAALVRALC